VSADDGGRRFGEEGGAHLDGDIAVRRSARRGFRNWRRRATGERSRHLKKSKLHLLRAAQLEVSSFNKSGCQSDGSVRLNSCELLKVRSIHACIQVCVLTSNEMEVNTFTGIE
jgi:hypothetical protein